MKNVIALILFFSFSTPSKAELLRADVLENQTYTISDENLIFLGHSTSFWDGQKTEAVAQKIIQLGNKYSLKTIATVAEHMANDEVLSSWHYFKQSDIDYLVFSRAGQHRLNFPRLKNMFVVGGNLGRCLCEGIRDIVRGFASNSHFTSVDLFLVIDGIYDGHPPFSPMKRTAVEGFVDNFFVPSFACPLQNWMDTRRLVVPQTSLQLYYGNEFIKSYDLEPGDATPLAELKNRINIRFIESSALEDAMAKATANP